MLFGRTRSVSLLFGVFCFCMALPRQIIQLNGPFGFEIPQYYMLVSSLFYICSITFMICIAMYLFRARQIVHKCFILHEIKKFKLLKTNMKNIT